MAVVQGSRLSASPTDTSSRLSGLTRTGGKYTLQRSKRPAAASRPRLAGEKGLAAAGAPVVTTDGSGRSCQHTGLGSSAGAPRASFCRHARPGGAGRASDLQDKIRAPSGPIRNCSLFLCTTAALEALSPSAAAGPSCLSSSVCRKEVKRLRSAETTSFRSWLRASKRRDTFSPV